MSWKNNRTVGFLVVSAIYLAAAALGVCLYRSYHHAWWLNLLLADVACTMFVYIFSVVFNNASVYAPYWSVQPLVIGIGFACGAPLTLPRLLMLAVVLLWGVRLTANWAYTFHGLAHQDWRYTMLRRQTGIAYPLVNFVGIHMIPTLIVYACMLPAACLFVYDVRANLGFCLAIAVSLGAAVLQLVADVQMHRFRKSAAGGFIRHGLWKYSRHPNYLGEILMWWGVGLAAVSVTGHWPLLLGAAVNTLLFLSVSIPMADKRQAAKAGFAEYKKQTRMLLPIKKKLRIIADRILKNGR